MIKKIVIIQFLSSLLSGFLISKISLLGKVAVSTFYTNFSFLKSWWKVFLLLFAFQLLIIFLLNFFGRKSKKIIYAIATVGIFVFLYCLYDFNFFIFSTLKTRFHLGFYLFFVSWIFSCFYFLKFLKEEKMEDKVNDEL